MNAESAASEPGLSGFDVVSRNDSLEFGTLPLSKRAWFLKLGFEELAAMPSATWSASFVSEDLVCGIVHSYMTSRLDRWGTTEGYDPLARVDRSLLNTLYAMIIIIAIIATSKQYG